MGVCGAVRGRVLCDVWLAELAAGACVPISSSQFAFSVTSHKADNAMPPLPTCPWLLPQLEKGPGLPLAGVMVCGDSGNDIELFAVPGELLLLLLLLGRSAMRLACLCHFLTPPASNPVPAHSPPTLRNPAPALPGRPAAPTLRCCRRVWLHGRQCNARAAPVVRGKPARQAVPRHAGWPRRHRRGTAPLQASLISMLPLVLPLVLLLSGLAGRGWGLVRAGGGRAGQGRACSRVGSCSAAM